MKHEFGVTITNDLQFDEIRSTNFAHISVLDLRHTPDGGAQGIEETCLKRLRNLHIGYQQIPINFDKLNSRLENQLFQTILEQAGNLLILTHNPESVARFCSGLNIPVRFRRLRLLTFATPVQPLAQDVEPRMLSSAAC